MIKAVAWDVDGTLADSEPTHHRALMAVSLRHGVHIAADDGRFIGVAMDAVWTALKPQYPPDLDRDAWLGEIVEAYIAHVDGLVAIPGAVASVKALAASGIRQCCVSNSARRIVDANLAALGIEPHIAFAIAREDVTEGKPSPEGYALACRRLGLAPARVLAIEDSTVGIAAARAAGLAVLHYGVDFTDFSAVLERVRGSGA